MNTSKLTGLAVAAVAATLLAAGAASANVSATQFEAQPKAGIQNVSFGYGPGIHRHRCYGFRRILPRYVIRHRLRLQGYKRIRHLHYRPGRLVLIGGYWRRLRGAYVATASKRFLPPRLRFRLKINPCSGRVIRQRGPIIAFHFKFGS